MPEYFIRITPYDRVSLDDVENLFKILKVERYVVSYEEASRPHYHAFLETSYTAERMRYQIKAHLNGQIYISGKEVQHKVKAIAYTIKDGNFRMKNIDVNEYLMAKSITHQKPNFDKELKEITDKEWTEDQKRQLTEEVLELYVKFNRKIYIQHIQAIVRTSLSKDKKYRFRLVEKILENL